MISANVIISCDINFLKNKIKYLNISNVRFHYNIDRKIINFRHFLLYYFRKGINAKDTAPKLLDMHANVAL